MCAPCMRASRERSNNALIISRFVVLLLIFMREFMGRACLSLIPSVLFTINITPSHSLQPM
jgi:hypothetical protein